MRIRAICVSLALLALVSACGGGGQETASPAVKAKSDTVHVLHAGMVTSLVRKDLKPAIQTAHGVQLTDVKGNSVALANSIKSGKLDGDIFMSADANVNKSMMGQANGNRVRWFAVFARNEVVLAYSPKSKYVNDFKLAGQGRKLWYQVLQQPGIKLGRDDPNADPLGYYDVFVGQLAERYYRVPGLKQRLLGADTNPKQVLNTSASLLTSGKLDAQFMYLNRATEGKVPYLRLPDQVNQSNPAMAGQYAAASFTNDKGETYRGTPIQVSIAPLEGAKNPEMATQLIQLLLSDQGKAILRKENYLPSPILVGGDMSAVPTPLRGSVAGTFHP